MCVCHVETIKTYLLTSSVHLTATSNCWHLLWHQYHYCNFGFKIWLFMPKALTGCQSKVWCAMMFVKLLMYCPPDLQPKTVAWSKSKEKKELKKKRKDFKAKKRQRSKVDDDDNEDLANDIRLMKKLKSGKVHLLLFCYNYYIYIDFIIWKL